MALARDKKNGRRQEESKEKMESKRKNKQPIRQSRGGRKIERGISMIFFRGCRSRTWFRSFLAQTVNSRNLNIHARVSGRKNRIGNLKADRHGSELIVKTKRSDSPKTPIVLNFAFFIVSARFVQNLKCFFYFSRCLLLKFI